MAEKPCRSWSAQEVDAAKRLLTHWREAKAALDVLRGNGMTAKLEVRGGVGWRSATLDLRSAETALRDTIAQADVDLAALGVDLGA